MTFLVNDPEKFPAESLEGFTRVYSNYVQPVHGGVVRSTASPEGEVAIVVGGGSGHYPAFAGWVGPGIGHGAVCGNIFASPSSSQVYSVVKASDNGGGALLLFGNYAGDVLHFGNAASQLQAEGIDTRIVTISDDIASNTPDKHDDRRGIAGDLFVVKVAGAAAAAGMSLDEVEAAARHANERSRTLGVAFTGCTLPGAAEPLFTVAEGTFGLGLGIHGEPGISSHDMMSASEIAAMLVEKVMEEEPDRGEGYDGRVAVLVNGLGSTKYEELFVLFSSVAKLLDEHGVTMVAPVVDEQVTSLDMAGVSLSLMFLDDQLEELWTAAADTPAFKTGTIEAGKERRVVAEEDADTICAGSAESAEAAKKAADMLALLEKTAREAEPELGRMDSIAGDGDHGQGMVLGSTAAARSAVESVEAKAGLRTLLGRAGAAWSEGAGGTSGALWGGAVAKTGAMLSDETAPNRKDILSAVIAGAASIQTMGGAKLGDKTMVDAVVPFVETLQSHLDDNAALADVWSEAAQAATEAAEKTADLVAHKGRARTHGDASLGTPDPGAISFALLMTAVAKELS